MKAKVSPLKITEFNLLESNFQFIFPKDEEIDVPKLFDSYSVDVEFFHKKLDSENFQVGCKIGVNNTPKPKPGYKMFGEAIGIFQLKDVAMTKPTRDNLKYYSSLNILINNLRNNFFQQSNTGPMSAYILPPIDIMDLFKKKKQKTISKNNKI
jgi:preprotein translocase subunit SecB